MSNDADWYRTSTIESIHDFRERPSRRSLSLFRLGAKALVTDGENVLLIKERRNDGSTFWTLPGGGIQPKESITDGLRREIAEELQCSCVIHRPVNICTYQHKSEVGLTTVYTIFACDLTATPVPSPQESVIDARWVSPLDPPSGTLNPIQSVLKHNNPNHATVD